VGREPELLCLREALEQALHASGAVVLVSGEAGIGKTTLVRRALQHAQRLTQPLLCAT
jgi:predicted ATPase